MQEPVQGDVGRAWARGRHRAGMTGTEEDDVARRCVLKCQGTKEVLVGVVSEWEHAADRDVLWLG
jgi:hypothetical protein